MQMAFEYYPVTLILLVVTCLISIRAFKDPEMKYKWMYYPYKVNKEKQFYRILSHVFIHADYTHLLFNMIVLFFFGRMMESTLITYMGSKMGSIYFLMLYLLGGIAASLWPYMRNHENPNYMSLGASGAVSAVLFASILWEPGSQLQFLFIPFNIPAWLFGILYLGFEFYMGRKGTGTIAHDAHFGGAIFGILYILFLNFDKGSAFIHYIFS